MERYPGPRGLPFVVEKWVQMGDKNLKEFPSCFVEAFKVLLN